MKELSDNNKLLTRQNLASMLVDDLRNRILNGELKSNTILRQEELALEYGVSRMPVREALKQLDSEGLVITEPNKGSIVSSLSKDEIIEIFDLRLLLELDLLKQSLPNITDLALKNTQSIIDQMNHAYLSGDISSWGVLNGKFHLSLYETANRPISLSIMNRLNTQADRYLRLQITMTSELLDGALEHQALLDLCRKKKSKEAMNLLSLHITRTKKQLLDIFSSHPS